MNMMMMMMMMMMIRKRVKNVVTSKGIEVGMECKYVK
jgi:hypothetical protein